MQTHKKSLDISSLSAKYPFYFSAHEIRLIEAFLAASGQSVDDFFKSFIHVHLDSFYSLYHLEPSSDSLVFLFFLYIRISVYEYCHLYHESSYTYKILLKQFKRLLKEYQKKSKIAFLKRSPLFMSILWIFFYVCSA